MQIIPLKFGSVWILHPKISEFEFYPPEVLGIWILHPSVSEFGFYFQKFRSVWTLDLTPLNSEISECKFQTLPNFKKQNPNMGQNG